MLELDEEEFWNWFKENSPLCGKMVTMKRICKAFPDSSFLTQQPFPPYKHQKYNSKAAILMNKWVAEGKLITEKQGRVWCYIVALDNITHPVDLLFLIIRNTSEDYTQGDFINRKRMVNYLNYCNVHEDLIGCPVIVEND